MSPAPASAESSSLVTGRRFERLPPWLRPRPVELPGAGRVRLVETTLLVLAGLLLATATVNDLVRQRNISERLIADLRTWRAYTGHDYHDLSVDQQLLGTGESSIYTARDVVCGNTAPGAPKSTPQLCLVVAGRATGGSRAVEGGWYLRAYVEDDVRAERYGCFGPAGQGLCPK
jgi:hypothetical protein